MNGFTPCGLFSLFFKKQRLNLWRQKLITSMSGWNRKLKGLQTNTEESLHSLEFATSQEAWEKLNEGFLRLDPILFEKGLLLTVE